MAGELLVFRHLSRLRDTDVLVVAPESGNPPALPPFCRTLFLPEVPRWIRAFGRGWAFPAHHELSARWMNSQVHRAVESFRPDVVVSVLLPDAYTAAGRLISRAFGVPSVLLCHDDYYDHIPGGIVGKAWFRRHLRQVYRDADERLCISPPMVEAFRRRYGAEGKVLYPIPGRTPARGEVAVRATRSTRPLRFGFAGTMVSGYVDAMIALADAIGRVGGSLHLMSPSSRGRFVDLWTHPAVTDVGQLSPAEVIEHFENHIDVSVVVQSFDPHDVDAFALNFPSKLVEYTTLGLPLLIVAPPSASAVTWACRHPGVAVAAAGYDAVELDSALEALADPQVRRQIACRMVEVASDLFDPDHLQRIFDAALGAASPATAKGLRAAAQLAELQPNALSKS